MGEEIFIIFTLKNFVFLNLCLSVYERFLFHVMNLAVTYHLFLSLSCGGLNPLFDIRNRALK